MRLTPNETKLLDQLRTKVECSEQVDQDGSTWQQVYLDNARGDFSPRTFAALLGSLSTKGFYRPDGDDFFGSVRTND